MVTGPSNFGMVKILYHISTHAHQNNYSFSKSKIAQFNPAHHPPMRGRLN